MKTLSALGPMVGHKTSAMNYGLWVGLVIAATIVVQAEEKFSQAIRSSDFAAAGLSKLTAEEIARLDALVADFKSGTLEATKRDLAAAQAKAAEAEARAGAASQKGTATVPTGTKVEYQPLESRIEGTINGWERQTVFRLENGQYWRVTDNDTYFSSALVNPKVQITPTAFGGFWMKIEGIDVRVRVMPMTTKK